MVFVVKSTIGFLALLAAASLALCSGQMRSAREIAFLAVPPSIWLLFATTGGLDVGVRHLLPIYPFLCVLIAGAVFALARRWRNWAYVAGVLLFCHVLSSMRAFPDYLSYSNEFWGGPDNTYKYLSDSNNDWAQQLIKVKERLDERKTQDCWFAYFAQPLIDFRAYGIPCRPLPTSNIGVDVPSRTHGTVLISASTLAGFEFGSSVLNPYRQFQLLRPNQYIGHGVFLYDGDLDTRSISALGHARRANALARSNQLQAALGQAEIAVQIDPDQLQSELALAQILRALGRGADAKAAYQKALIIVGTMEPDVANRWGRLIEAELSLVNTGVKSVN